MDERDLVECMEFVLQLTDTAGKVMEEGFYGEKQISFKRGNWDVVTDYDVRVEKLVMEAIRQRYPTHRLLGEESASESKLSSAETPLWLIDPIDGTYNYAHGFPASCISIGLAVDGKVVLAVVHDPINNVKYTAIKGKGAFRNGRPIRVSKQPGLKDGLVSFELALIRHPQNRERNTNRYLAITHQTNGIRTLGSAALSLCVVASGGLDAFFHEYLSPWDIAAGSLIVTEAGGFVCHFDGSQFDTMGRNVLASANKKVAEDILAVFAEFP